ncbi:MAG: Uma2 family endonuclease [Pseudonocardia sp.]|nr:Uma2 family endonuclease [Pseudonocardia sp.]
MNGAATVLPPDVTWEQFLELLDQDEYKNAELIDGQVVVGTPSWLHQRIVMTLCALIWNWIHAGENRGEVTFNPRVKITHNRGHLPDVAWYRGERVSAKGVQPDGPPDLAVEVLSPSTRTFDIVRKRADYARIWVNELWLTDPDGPEAVVLRRDGAEFVVVDDLAADGALTGPQLPGLSIVVGQLVSL